MRTEPGSVEYQVLTDAYEDLPPACIDDWRYVQEREEIDADDLERMARTGELVPADEVWVPELAAVLRDN